MRVLPDFLFDDLEGLARAAALIFDRAADDPAGVGDEIRDREDVARVEGCFGGRRNRDIGPLDNQLRLEAGDVFLPDHIGARGRDPDVAVDVDDRVAVQLLSRAVIRKALAGAFEVDQRVDVQARRVGDRGA